MKTQTYFKVSGTIFFIVAILHAWRLLNGLPFKYGTFSLPMWFSWVAVILAGSLAFQGLKKR